MFHSVGAGISRVVDHPIPLRKLVDFERRTLVSGAAPTEVRFDVPVTALTLTNTDGDKIVYAGRHYLTVSNGISPGVKLPIDVPETIAVDVAPARGTVYQV